MAVAGGGGASQGPRARGGKMRVSFCRPDVGAEGVRGPRWTWNGDYKCWDTSKKLPCG